MTVTPLQGLIDAFNAFDCPLFEENMTEDLPNETWAQMNENVPTTFHYDPELIDRVIGPSFIDRLSANTEDFDPQREVHAWLAATRRRLERTLRYPAKSDEILEHNILDAFLYAVNDPLKPTVGNRRFMWAATRGVELTDFRLMCDGRCLLYVDITPRTVFKLLIDVLAKARVSKGQVVEIPASCRSSGVDDNDYMAVRLVLQRVRLPGSKSPRR